MIQKLVNSISIFRIIASPVLIYLAFTKNQDLFKWLLFICFFSDLIDGFIARRFNATSILGSKLDSIGDDLTIVSAIVGAFIFHLPFIKDVLLLLIILFGVFVFQNILAFLRYKRMTSFHTYLAKSAAILQGCFFILLFFLKDPSYPLFYLALIMTFLDLVEEIILIYMLPQWETNVKGIYWVLKRKKKK